jgi:catechol 2,3-dioxygenase-like lactoylglutathione lyase family enzyme
MKFRLMSVFVDDQEKALAFYTDVLTCVASVRTSTCRKS